MNFNPPNLSSAKELVYDTETDGLDWKKNKVVGYVLTWGGAPDETAYYPVRHCGGGAEHGNLDPEPVERYIRSLAAREDLFWTGHHMKFDLHMSLNHGIEFKGKLNCTQVNAALIDEEQDGGYSLDSIARAYGVTEKKGDALYKHIADLFGGQPVRSQMGQFWRLRGDDPLGVDYAIGDGISTWEVWKHQQKVLADRRYDENDKDKDGNPRLTMDLMTVWALECRVLRTLFHMERRGVKIDLQRYEQITKYIQDEINKMREDDFGVDFKPLSNSHVLEYLQRNGVTGGWASTTTGKASLTAKFLETIPVGQKIIKLRKYENLQSSFIEGQIANHLHNGRIHTTFNQLKADEYGTITGRLSSSQPNLQQVPKRDKILAPIFRSMFVPDEGFKWSANDYKQQEFVVFAHYSNSKMLIDGYNQTPVIDMHQRCADLLNVERDPRAKRINLGKLYWMGVIKLAAQLDMPINEVRKLSDLWDKALPEAAQFRVNVKARAEAVGYVKDFLGRRRRYPQSRMRYSYQAPNSVIQMSSASITKLKMVEIDEYFQKMGGHAQLLLQVHDELDWQFPVGMEHLDKEAIRIMEDFSEGQPIHLRAKLGVDSSYGDDWKEASFG